MNTRFKTTPRTNKLAVSLVLFMALGISIGHGSVMAGDLDERSLTMSSSAPNEVADYTLEFVVELQTAIRSLEVEVCSELDEGSCQTPDGFSAASATLETQPVGFGDTTGWSIDNSDSGKLRISHADNTTSPGALQQVTFNNVTNPEDPNKTFFLKVTTFSNSDYTGAIDDGVIAVTTSTAVTVRGFVQPVLSFCVAITISGDCSTASGSHINFGEFNPNSTSVATSQMRAHTNAIDGYVITVTGATLASGSNIIPAMSSFGSSEPGTGQFGINLANNTNPNAGSGIAGGGNGSIVANYAQPNLFKFESGDLLASAPGVTADNTYTTTYIANITSDQPPGVYAATLTYIITATF